MFVRKIFRIGNALGVTLPKDYLRKMKMEAGDYTKIELFQDKKEKKIVITSLLREVKENT